MDKKIIALVVCLVFAVGFIVPFAFAAKGGKAKPACNDRIDNDGDGYTDLADPGCQNKRDTSELNPNVECDDGTDNDGDNAVDYNDGGCSDPTDNDETNCGDGVCEGGETPETCQEDCGYPNSCNDTDGGFNVIIQGTVSGYYNDEYYSYTDNCTETYLLEWYCSGTQADNYLHDCTLNYTTCSNGACI